MAEHCKNCGLELFTAQRFCRSCGAPTEQLSEEQIPTRIMPPQAESWGARGPGATAPASKQETSPVYEPPIGYQPSVPPVYPAVVPPYVPPRKRTPVGWILAFLGMGLFVLVVIAVMMMARFGRSRVGDSGGGPTQPAIGKQGERQLDATTADTEITSGNETALTKLFVLGNEAKLSLNNINGNITVSAWDRPEAEVKVIRRGSPDRNSQVFFSQNGGNLSVRTAQGRGDVRFEVKVPREIARIALSSTNGTIKLSDVRGEILVDATNGAIELTGVSGVSKVQTTNGSIKATLLEASDRPMEFSSTNGTLDLIVPFGFAADLEASTVHGAITLGDGFEVEVEKERVGQKAQGEIGEGGERLRLKTVNGNITLSFGESRAKESAKGKAKNGN